jgi:hypothetical protein
MAWTSGAALAAIYLIETNKNLLEFSGKLCNQK